MKKSTGKNTSGTVPEVNGDTLTVENRIRRAMNTLILISEAATAGNCTEEVSGAIASTAFDAYLELEAVMALPGQILNTECPEGGA